MDAAEGLATQLVQLVRGLRDLNAASQGEPGLQLDLPTAVVLGRVGEEGPLRLSALAERLSLDLSTVSRQVPALERAGWLVREADPTDRRAQLLRLTEEGQRVLAERRRAQARLLAAALPGWSDDEIGDLAARLDRLNRDLSAHRQASLRRVGSTSRTTSTTPAHLEAS